MISYLYTMSSDYPFLIFLPSLSAPPCHCQSFPRVMTWVLFCVLVYPGHMYICATDLELTIGTWWDHQWVHKWGGGKGFLFMNMSATNSSAVCVRASWPLSLSTSDCRPILIQTQCRCQSLWESWMQWMFGSGDDVLQPSPYLLALAFFSSLLCNIRGDDMNVLVRTDHIF